MIFSSPGCIYDESYFMDKKKNKGGDLVKISKLENLGTLDITELLKSIYNGFDGIFVVIKGKLNTDKFISEFNSFHKPIEEVNRILKRRGLSNQRVKLFKFDGTNQTELYATFKNFLRKLIYFGPNPINSGIRKIHIKSDYHYEFEHISIQKLLYASYKASYNYHYRSLPIAFTIGLNSLTNWENFLRFNDWSPSEIAISGLGVLSFCNSISRKISSGLNFFIASIVSCTLLTIASTSTF